MEDRHNRRPIGLIAVATMLIPLVWAIGLIGRGIWQLSEQDKYNC